MASADVKPDNLYNKNFINWRSKTNDTPEWYTEVIANQLLSESRLRWLDEIKTITRMKGSYFVNEHSLNNIVVNDTKRREENMAKHILKDMKPFESVGLMIDYQVPLKNTSSDKAGKVDLVSFDYETNTIRLFELKNPDRYMKTPETLLRCVLESYTYLKTIDQNKLIKDLPEKLERVKEELIQNGHEELVKYATINNDNKLRIQAHILIAKDNLQHSKMIREDSNYHQKVVELMNKLGITPFIYEYDDINGSPIITKITKYN